MPIGDYVQLLEDYARSALNQETARLRSRGVEVSMVLKSGDACERILETAKELDVGLIVMGTHGRRGLPRALIGSVAERILRRSPVPVLTIHAQGEERDATTGEPSRDATEDDS